MDSTVDFNHRVRFKAFELDCRTRELRRNGTRLKLQGQPIDVLTMLLEKPGELVTREALRKKLWPEDTFVDFEHSLNSTIARLRDALGDRAEDPKYIETLPRLGYRSVGRVETENGQVSAPGVSTNSVNTAQSALADVVAMPQVTTSPVGESTLVKPLSRLRWSRRVLIAGTSLVLITAATLRWYAGRPLPPHVGEIKQLTRDVRFLYKRPLGVGGGRVYFSGIPRGLFAVASSGDVETIPLVLPWSSDLPIWAWDVSPDGEYFLAWPMSNRPASPLWMFTTAGKPVRYLADARWPGGSWSPDGKQVIYLAEDGKVYTVSSAGGESRFLFTSPSADAVSFSWSPDRKRIRYSSAGQIWEVEPDGSNRHEFLPGMKGSLTKCCGRWTPDGAYYIFASATKLPGNYLEAGQLWALDERLDKLLKPNHDPVQLTSGPMEWSFLVISPDSRTVFATGTVRQGELVRFDTRAGQFVQYMGALSAVWLHFSPDGKYVAYISYPDRKIWRANRDGSDRIVLAEPEGVPEGLRWSPDGTKIVFAVSFWDPHGRRESNEVYMLSPHGGKLERVQLPPGESPTDPTWSPDGRRLAYTAEPDHGWTPNGIRILDLETHRSAELPAAPTPVWSPRWSPNGRYIFCAAESHAGSAVFDTDTQKWTHFRANIEVDYPNWAHDSRSVYFLGSTAALDGVYQISIPSGHTERVVNLESVRLANSTGASWLGLDPEDHPLLLRDAGSVEVYALTLERK